jgi:hypothetical protein
LTARSVSRSSLGWAFGISLSVLLVSIWGRAVVADTDALAESLAPLAQTDAVVEYVAGWMGDEMVESGIAPEAVEPTVRYFVESSTVGEAADELAAEVVTAAASTDPGGSSIDMRALLAPAVPEVTLGLAGLGMEIDEATVRAVVEDFEPLVIRAEGEPALVGPASETASRLGTASLLAVVGLLVFGWGFVALSDDRISGLRSLFQRVSVGALSFAVFLRLGAWVIDPSGGRAPIPETVANLAGSKWLIPLQIAVVAGVVAGAIYLTRRWLRRGQVVQSSTPQPDSLTRSR